LRESARRTCCQLGEMHRPVPVRIVIFCFFKWCSCQISRKNTIRSSSRLVLLLTISKQHLNPQLSSACTTIAIGSPICGDRVKSAALPRKINQHPDELKRVQRVKLALVEMLLNHVCRSVRLCIGENHSFQDGDPASRCVDETSPYLTGD
jgi:hypothetical protein